MKTKIISILIILAIFIGSGALIFSLTNEECDDKYPGNDGVHFAPPNGCTWVPDKIKCREKIFGNLYYIYYDFTPACNTHDYCYMTLNKSKKECDKEFLNNMLSTRGEKRSAFYDTGVVEYVDCKDNSTCSTNAKTYYGGVVGAGYILDFYEDAQEKQQQFIKDGCQR